MSHESQHLYSVTTCAQTRNSKQSRLLGRGGVFLELRYTLFNLVFSVFRIYLKDMKVSKSKVPLKKVLKIYMQSSFTDTDSFVRCTRRILVHPYQPSS